MRVIQGNLVSKGYRFSIVVSRFNESISGKLLEGAMDCLLRSEVREQDITVIWVPGAFEIPLVAQTAAQNPNTDAVICLGAVIRGGTPHFEYVAAEVSKGVAQAALKTGKPVIFGVLTTDSVDQAIERAGTKAGNKGFSAASSALEMVSLMREIQNGTTA
ncbi:MAG: 6,7-dimethyl-8-ribityllumazine synthase [Candidatus Cloacimonetes bacterium]|jgi:6,7-dimethyl-8-ribityllumazine synthase|nr:6,7-dimethyl-8-ribityllumazine synthase [Candidatus Cloacimonadota bacterium]MDY0337711.1 6,7-dimethyl-8-ribityllumazine synthase [Candidatus Cloacimonadaceae bacterium]MCK9334448.1 6,7-dimethyl-8-ribityllumazine synthase [Candidatus Cloacimonadota bacterium]MDD2544249.1 6,7-dimethyl-8-ribityllumazine synthase [Candidatus Cloacimonadota bacterium]MDD2683168.1 6,7-dimethyl-8-ribityllumazine synthase [Candidatus Cloacimonadota bacterium]